MNIDHEIVDQGLYAEEALSTEDFDYVFVDLKLPDMNGWEIIADHSDLIKTKFIPMTGYENEYLKTEARTTNYVRRFNKPFSEEELLDCFDEIELYNDTVIEEKDLSKTLREALFNQCIATDPKNGYQQIKALKKELKSKLISIDEAKNKDFIQLTKCILQVKKNCTTYKINHIVDTCTAIENSMNNEAPLEDLEYLVRDLKAYIDETLKVLKSVQGDIKKHIAAA